MGVAARSRNATAPRRRPPDRPAKKPSIRRPTVRAAYRRGLMTGFGGGLSVALVIVVAAVLFGPGPASSPHGHQGQADDTAVANDRQDSTTPSASVDVDATHEGDLQVHIEARVSSLDSDAALLRAEVVAYTDMTSMPLAHREGPITLTEIPGRPGYYEATTQVPMVGEYDIHVETRAPLEGNGHQVITVGTVSPGEG